MLSVLWNYSEYKEMLIKSVRDILEIWDYDIEQELLSKKLLINSDYFKRKRNYHFEDFADQAHIRRHVVSEGIDLILSLFHIGNKCSVMLNAIIE
jgi:hypothetical protein